MTHGRQGVPMLAGNEKHEVLTWGERGASALGLGPNASLPGWQCPKARSSLVPAGKGGRKRYNHHKSCTMRRHMTVGLPGALELVADALASCVPHAQAIWHSRSTRQAWQRANQASGECGTGRLGWVRAANLSAGRCTLSLDKTGGRCEGIHQGLTVHEVATMQEWSRGGLMRV
jgi:hypothetical protein